jgi:glycosyltransferase involved in cell wall biosynthesis
MIGDGSYRNDALGVLGEPWNPDTEIERLAEMDIGIMPLADDEWPRGKCGLKGLQFMALEVPVVMENVGANEDIVTDAVAGLLASGDEAWVPKLSSLAASADVRERLGLAGRRTVETRFSVDSKKAAYVEVFQDLFAKAPTS